MSFFLHDNLDSSESFEPRGSSTTRRPEVHSSKDELHILGDKIRIPNPGRIMSRPRLDDLIEKSLSQFGATLISGRSGTGKTSLAADYAQKVSKSAWYSMETSDADWATFSRYFAASVCKALGVGKPPRPFQKDNGEVTKVEIAQYLSDIFALVDAEPAEEPVLIVLDDLHRIFDAEWFGEFFNLLLYSLRENTQLLLICRSRPPSPLWRLRSKQMLNVIDEKLLAFNSAETMEFFAVSGLSKKTAKFAQAESFGRIAKVMQIASKSLKQSRLQSISGR